MVDALTTITERTEQRVDAAKKPAPSREGKCAGL